MKTVWKYKLKNVDEQKIVVPKNAQILCAQMQKDDLMIWALVEKNAKETEEKTIFIFGTGHNVPNIDMKYIGTIQRCNRSLVFHVFEGLEK